MPRKKIRILIDLDSMAVSQKSGVGYYCSGLLESLSKAAGGDAEIVGHYFNFLGRRKPGMPKLPNVTYRQTKLIPRQLINLFRRLGIPVFYELLIKARGDFILFPNFIGHRSLFGTPMATIVHDLAYLDRPEDVTRKNREDLSKLVPRFIENSCFVIAISGTTKQSLVDHYGIAQKKIIVSPMAPLPKVIENGREPETKLPKKYILFFGTLDPRKNFMNLVKAYSEELNQETRKKYGLVLAGGYGWNNAEELEQIKRLQQQSSNIITTGYIDDNTRSYIFQNASVFVLPSHYEGFGIPILEAMAYGIPTAVSDIPVFHEVAGNAAVFFNQNKPADIAKSIEKILANKKLSTELVEKGKQNLKRFNWDTVGQLILSKIAECL